MIGQRSLVDSHHIAFQQVLFCAAITGISNVNVV